MSPTRGSALAFVASLSLATTAFAQHSPLPTAYTVTEVNAMFGPGITMTTYRNGPVAVVDHREAHIRVYYDLATSRSFSWSTSEPNPPCGTGTFSGDWGDPFQTQDLTNDLAKYHAKDVGTEMLNGIGAKVVEADNPQGGPKIRLWIDTTYGEVIKWVGSGADGGADTLVEMKSFKVGTPASAYFVLPPSCAKIAGQPPPPTEAQRIAALTGSAQGAYVPATNGPASSETCSVQFSVARPGTVAPIGSGFRVGVDPSVDPQHGAAYAIGNDIAAPGKPFFSGGGLREVTSAIQNGVVKLPSVAPVFDLELVFGDSGSASGMIYRQCFGRSTAKLVYVVKNPAKLFDGGDWLWAK